MTRGPGLATSGATTLFLLSGALIFLLWLPGLCLKQSQGWMDEIAAETARADSLRDAMAAPVSTTLGESGGQAPTSSPDTPTTSLDFPDGRFSMTVVDGSRVELVFPAGWSASSLIEVVASGRTGQRNGDTWAVTPRTSGAMNRTTTFEQANPRDMVGLVDNLRSDTTPFKLTVTKRR